MSRFLTPFKLCLLQLTVMYASNDIPSNRVLGVLKFIADQILSQNSTIESDSQDENSSAIRISAILDVLKPPASGGDNIKDSVAQDFLAALKALQSLDELFRFFTALRIVLCSPEERELSEEKKKSIVTIAENSLLGVFVRRCYLEWERLSFEDSVALWQQFEQFREPIPSLWTPTRDRETFLGLQADWDADAPGTENQSTTNLTAVLERNTQIARVNATKLGPYDVERLLQFQLEKMATSGVRLPPPLVKHFEVLARRSREVVHLLSYARFLDAWFAGDYTSAFENLHQYYDYSARNNDRTQYQYALLNMAILHADFGSYDEAAAAMTETISLARENKDMACLNISLSWVFRFRKNFDQSKRAQNPDNPWLEADSEALEFLKSKATEEKMWSVVSSAVISQAEMYLSQGLGPNIAFQRSYQSSQLNLTHDLGFLRPEQLLLHARLMYQLGDSSLSDSYKNLVLDCYGDSSPVNAKVAARCELMMSYADAADWKAAEKIAKDLSSQSYQSRKVTEQCSDYVKQFRAVRAIHHGRLNEAERILDELRLRSGADASIQFQVTRLFILYYLKRHDFSTALTKVNDALNHLEKQDGNVEYRIRLLTAKANIFAACGRAQKGATLAMRASAAARAIKHMPIYWAACSALSKSLNAIGEFQAALGLLKSIIFQAALARDESLKAEMASSYADAYVGQVGKIQADKEASGNSMMRAVYWLQRALVCYENLQDSEGVLEMHQKLHVAHRYLGNETGQVTDAGFRKYVPDWSQEPA